MAIITQDKQITLNKDLKAFLIERKLISRLRKDATSGKIPIIDDEIGYFPRRPLIELGISGRRREKQMELARELNMKYPLPAGGCLLCEKALKQRFKILLEKNLISEKTISLVKTGRHFFLKNCWFIVGKDESENKVIEKFKNRIESAKGKPAVYFSKKTGKKFAEELQNDFKKEGKKRYSGIKI